MRFDVLRDPKKIEAIRSKLNEEYRERRAQREQCGAIVRYVMPRMQRPFPRLLQTLETSSYRAQFYDIYYFIEMKERSLRRLMPAAEYYKFAFRAVADKLYSIRVGYRRVRELEQEIQEVYASTRELTYTANQPSFNVTDQVYSLKAAIAGVLFEARAVLDIVASLMHFLYGPSSRQFVSFADFAKHLRKSAKDGQPLDEELLAYVEENMKWFATLRDLRDYVTHHSSIDVSFYEQPHRKLLGIVQDIMPVDELVETAALGVHNFCSFADVHFANRLGSGNMHK